MWEVAMLTIEKTNKWGEPLSPGMEFLVEPCSGGFVIRYSCDDYHFKDPSEVESLGLKLFGPGESPLAIKRKEFPIQLQVGSSPDGLMQEYLPADLPQPVYNIQFWGNVAPELEGSSDRVLAVIDRGVKVIEFPTPRIYWGGTTRVEGCQYSHGSGDGFMSPGYD